MVLVSSELSDGSVIRSRNENGSCSMNGASVCSIKWKHRSVSANRDFPPGCGPIVRAIDVDPIEPEPLSSAVVGDFEGNDTGTRTVSALRDYPPGCGPIVRVNDVDLREPEPLSSPVVGEGNDTGTPVVGNDEGNDTGNSEQVVGEGKDTGTPVVGNDEGNDTGNSEQVVGEGKDTGTPVVGNDEGNDTGNSEQVVADDIPMIKFSRRRVSAMRDFPPYCGLNAEEPTEEERIRINGKRTCETASNQRVKDGCETQSNKPSVAEEKQMTVTSNVDVENRKNNKLVSSNIGQACQELVVYTRDKVLKTRSPVDDNCDVDYEEDSLDHKSVALIEKGTRKTKNQEVGSKHAKRRLDNDDPFMGEKIKVVLGLRAPSFRAPGVQEKDLSIKAKGDASMAPNKSIEKKRKDQEKIVEESSTYGKLVDSRIPKRPATKQMKLGSGAAEDKEVDEDREVDAADKLEMVVKNEEDDVADIDLNGFAVTLPPYGPTSSNDARDKVRKTLRFFQTLCRKLLQGEEAKTDDIKLPKKRVDLGAKAIMDRKGLTPKLDKKTHGPIPGVEVGDEFQYRVELALVGIHRPFQGGIDFVKKGKEFFAVSVVASGGYDNDIDKPDCLMYSGSGGVGKDKSFENQKLERGNLALKNNVDLRYPVRVIRGYKVKSAEASDSKSKMTTMYIYDGLYTVEACHNVPGPHGNMVYKFELKRVPGQPQLAIREVSSKKFKTREGVCVKDITNGKEVFPICAINTIDDEKPPAFTYISKMMYPDWYKPIPPKGCNCVGRCSDKRCPCAARNGGEIPYNRNGAIVEAKQLVYECGPSCSCSPTCYNRVTQKGMKIHLEIFKTEKRGWGVRSLSSISSGSFICEYIGELLDDTEAEKLAGNDEYLFDIGQNYNDCSLNPDINPVETVKEAGGFTIDALNYGNVGRFINHSCSPNLYAQNVLYDQDDKRMPHIMLFAAENIPPLQELTYHYNYAVGTVRDADGNVKEKSCFCGSSDCSGRLY